MPLYYPQLEYEYSIGGRNYTGTRIAMILPRSDFRFKKRIYEQYPVGTLVSVFYDPRDPENSVLEPGVQERVITFWDFVKISVGLLFLWLGLND